MKYIISVYGRFMGQVWKPRFPGYEERELDAAIQWSEIYKIGKLKRLKTKNLWCISKCCEYV